MKPYSSGAAFSFAILSAFVLATTGCGTRSPESSKVATTSAPPKIATTKEWLRTCLNSHSVFRNGTLVLDAEKLSPRDRYYVAGYQRGLDLLESATASDFTHPTILTAVVEETDASPIALVVHWLSSEECTGIYVQDAKGNVLIQGAMFTPISGEEVRTQEGLLEYGVARISPKGDEDIPQLKLDQSDLARDLWVGLVEKDGRRSKPIRAFVEEKLRNSPRSGEE